VASLAVEASNPQRRAPSPRSWRTRSCGGGERLSCLGLGKGCTCPRCRRFPPGPVALRRPLCLPGACWRAEVTVGSRPSFLSVARCASSVAPARHLQHAWPTPSRGEASIRCRGSTAAVGRVQRAGPCGLVRRRALGARWAGRAGMGGCTHQSGDGWLHTPRRSHKEASPGCSPTFGHAQENCGSENFEFGGRKYYRSRVTLPKVP
jgi:hypothetical protein